jgi:predicted restriction endonuclease
MKVKLKYFQKNKFKLFEHNYIPKYLPIILDYYYRRDVNKNYNKNCTYHLLICLDEIMEDKICT